MSAAHGRPKARSFPQPRSRTRVGLLGGSFDPVHVGHLALGRAAAEALGLDRLIVMPTGRSWQKAETGDVQTGGHHRLEMIRIALRSLPQGRTGGCEWVADDLEVRREGPSYTVETLQVLRSRLGPETALILILGSDQLRNLATWHRWQQLTDFAHIAATQRERVPLSGLPEAVDQLLVQRGAQALPDEPAGSVTFFPMPPVAVSASGIRKQLACAEAPGELLPPGVAEYIRLQGLYRH